MVVLYYFVHPSCIMAWGLGQVGELDVVNVVLLFLINFYGHSKKTNITFSDTNLLH